MATPKWPRDHKAKHAAAARKGWANRLGLGDLKARVSLRPHNYHGQGGYLISGKDVYSRSVSIFSRTKAEATQIRNAIKAGREPVFRRKG